MYLVDIHSHVLYGMDDGPKTLEVAQAMIEMAAASGTTHLVATPHANSNYTFDPALIRERLAELRALAPAGIELCTGCDFHLSVDNIEDAIRSPRKYTINQGKYLLVEFSDLMIFPTTAQIFSRLQDAGMVPIITHPERNDLLRYRLEQMSEWVDNGALIQVTGQSLSGHFGRRAKAFSQELLNRRMVHFIASDGHDLKHRPPKMDEAYSILTEQYGESAADKLCKANPRAVVENGRVDPLPADAVRTRKWFQVWR